MVSKTNRLRQQNEKVSNCHHLVKRTEVSIGRSFNCQTLCHIWILKKEDGCKSRTKSMDVYFKARCTKDSLERIHTITFYHKLFL